MSWSPHAVALALLGNGVACLAAGVGLLRVKVPLGQARTGYSKSTAARLLLASIVLAQVCCVFWGWALWYEYYTLKLRAQIPPSFKWSLAWLPTSPLVVCVICKCVADMNAEMQHSVGEATDAPLCPFFAPSLTTIAPHTHTHTHTHTDTHVYIHK
jgi:hypothetical protein